MNLNKKFYDDYVWALKYRPTNINDVVLPKTVQDNFNKMLSSGKIPNMLFYGQQGIGKTTIATILADTLGCDTLYINGSIETSIDVLRGKITQFVTTVSFDGGKKMVLLDECLEENEVIATGTIDNPTYTKLKDFELGKQYDVLSYNLDTNQLENDTAEIISEKQDEVFEVELEDGRTIKANVDHPFFVDRNGEIVEVKLKDLQEGDEIVTLEENRLESGKPSEENNIKEV